MISSSGNNDSYNKKKLMLYDDKHVNFLFYLFNFSSQKMSDYTIDIFEIFCE